MTKRVRLTVRKVHGDSNVRPGVSFEFETPALIGRSPAADVRLQDSTVSHQHARVEDGPQGVHVVNLSQRSATLVNRERLSVGESARLWPGQSTLQAGGVLMLLGLVDTTSAFGDDLEGDDLAPPFISVATVGDVILIRIDGQALQFPPRPARALRLLARRPGQVTAANDLLDAADPDLRSGNVNQLITYVRNVIRDAIEQNGIRRAALRNLVMHTEHGSARLTKTKSADTRALLAALIQNVRGAGYRLNMPPAEIAVTIADP